MDFGFLIGIYVEVDKETGRIIRRVPTTRGMIHYGRKGIHIGAVRPKDE